MQSHVPVVSVVIPSYNYGRFVAEAIESVQRQTFSDWECIVVDDGSTDETDAVVSEIAHLDSRVRLVQQPNRGLSAARNAGIETSSGRFIQFLDADDRIETRKLELQVAYLEQHPHVDIIYGNVVYLSDTRGVGMTGSGTEWMHPLHGRGNAVLLSLVESNALVVNAALIRSKLADRVGGFNESLPAVEDWDYWLRAAAEGAWFEFHPLEDTAAVVRVHSHSMMTDSVRMLSARLAMRQDLAGRVDDALILDRNAELAAEEEGTLGIVRIEVGHRSGGIQHLFRAAATSRRKTRKLAWILRALLALVLPPRVFSRVARGSFRERLPLLRDRDGHKLK